MSYNPGNFYGNDQISFDPYDARDLLNFNTVKPMMDITDSNSVSNVNNIKNMETRLLTKINNIRPSCNKQPYCKHYPNDQLGKVPLFSPEGSYIEQNRIDIRKNIEDHYFGGRYYKPSDACNNRPHRDCNNSNPELFFNQRGDNNIHNINHNMMNDNIPFGNRINVKKNNNITRNKENMINNKINNNTGGYVSQLYDLLHTDFSGDRIGDNLIYLFLVFCVFIIIIQNNNITYLNKIVSDISKKKIIESE
jgi:hypothetical protein